jgi:hypothetical protein
VLSSISSSSSNRKRQRSGDDDEDEETAKKREEEGAEGQESGAVPRAAERSRRASNGKRRKKSASKSTPLPPLPKFPRSERAFVAVRRAHEFSTRFKFTLRLRKDLLPLGVLQDIAAAKLAAAATASPDGVNSDAPPDASTQAFAASAASSSSAAAAAAAAAAVVPRPRPRCRSPPPSSESDESLRVEDDDDVVLSPGCCICGGMEHPSDVLLCDQCNAEVHMYCNVPPLRTVPKGQYFCPPCRQRSKEEAVQARLAAKAARSAAFPRHKPF